MDEVKPAVMTEVTEEMHRAWCEFEPVGHFDESMSFARFNGMMRHAFMAGFIANTHQSRPLGVEREAVIEKLARKLIEQRGVNPDTLYEHHEWEDLPTDERIDRLDPFTKEPRVTLMHRAWRNRVKNAVEILDLLTLTDASDEGREAVRREALEEAARIAETLRIGGGTLSGWVNTNESPMGATQRHIATAIGARALRTPNPAET